MEHSKRIEKYRIIMALTALTFLLVFSLALSILYYNIFEPAYVSYVSACNPTEFNETYIPMGYYIVGTFETTEDYQTGEINQTINIYYEDDAVYKHENCHKVQYNKYRLNSCGSPILFYFDEVECYTSQYLPDFIYKLKYGNFK